MCYGVGVCARADRRKSRNLCCALCSVAVPAAARAALFDEDGSRAAAEPLLLNPFADAGLTAEFVHAATGNPSQCRSNLQISTSPVAAV